MLSKHWGPPQENLTKQITPELCSTELCYDGSNRAQTLIDAEGCRTSYSYNTDRWCTGIHAPDGGRCTYTYRNYETTAVIERSGAITTLVHNTDRSIKTIVDPLGARTTNIGDGDLIKAEVHANGNRTSLVYGVLQGLRELAGRRFPRPAEHRAL